MEIVKLTGNYGACNTYILKSANEAAVIDPSVSLSEILNAIGDHSLRYILLTHGHFDHMLTLDELRAATGVGAYIHRADAVFLTDPELNASSLLPNISFTASPAEHILLDGDRLDLGDEIIKVLYTPGHTEGSVCYECGNILICGDTIFDIGYGRYDLPSGDPYRLAQSLRMLAERPDDPMIYPGHGSSCPLSCAEYIIYLRKNL